MQIILNELSAKFPVETIEDGKKIMESFLNVCFNVKKIIQNDSILLDKDYQSFELARGYRIEQWRNDSTVDVENKRKFRRLLNQAVVYNSEEFKLEDDFGTEFQCRGAASKGCLLVYEMDGVAVSFLSEEYWERAVIEGDYLELMDDGTVKQNSVEIPNVSCDENVILFKIYYDKHKEAWRHSGIVSGQDILKYVKTAFPNLIFCENAVQNCRKNVGVAEAGQVYKRLLELQRAAEAMGNKFDKDTLPKATPESVATLNRFSNEHTYSLPDGNEQLFSWHVRYTGGYAGRIFFHPVPKNGMIYIGYIGKKLPTVEYH